MYPWSDARARHIISDYNPVEFSAGQLDGASVDIDSYVPYQCVMMCIVDNDHWHAKKSSTAQWDDFVFLKGDVDL
jgi:hypothetical protein